MRRVAKNYTEIPPRFPLCIHAECPKAETCLRQLAFRRHEELGTYLRLINPGQCSKQGDCQFYADCTPVQFAKGFTNFQKQMYPQQYEKFMSILISHFGRNQYFSRRRGDILLTPDEQDVVRKALKDSGVDAQMEFDQYIGDVLWVP